MAQNSNPLDHHEISVIIKNLEEQTIRLDGRMKAIIAKFLEWREDINDPHANSVQVVVDCIGTGKGDKATKLSVRKME